MPKNYPTHLTFKVNDSTVSIMREAILLQPEKTNIERYVPGSGELLVDAYLTSNPDVWMSRVYKKARQLKE